jgi:hypothetical protein
MGSFKGDFIRGIKSGRDRLQLVSFASSSAAGSNVQALAGLDPAKD